MHDRPLGPDAAAEAVRQAEALLAGVRQIDAFVASLGDPLAGTAGLVAPAAERRARGVPVERDLPA
jgi:hypothetical protein